jgi:hypothetical protein
MIANMLTLALVWVCNWTGHKKTLVFSNASSGTIALIFNCEIASIITSMPVSLELSDAASGELIAHAFCVAC